jgi:hypothetical protein
MAPTSAPRSGLRRRNVLFAVYAPPGIESEGVLQHIEDIRHNILIVSPQASTDLLRVFGADGSD